jgi:hypothetical protein
LSLIGSDFHCADGKEILLSPSESLTFSGVRISKNEPNTIYDVCGSEADKVEVEFIRIPNLEECVNNVIITGEYYDVDDPENKLLFRPDGVVTGLEKFWEIDYTSDTKDVSYYIMLDTFMSDYDRILLGSWNASERISCYIYEFQGDTLLIYDSYERHGGRDFKGELAYRLKRLR